MNEFHKRCIAGAVLVAATLFLIFWKNTIPFGIAVVAIIIIGNIEMYNLLRAASEPVHRLPLVAGSVMVPICFYFQSHWSFFAMTVAALFIITFILKMATTEPTNGVVRFLGINIFGALFFPLCASFIWLVRTIENGQLWVLLLLISIWVSDSSAYFVGRKIGSIKIVPKISPKKSLQGFIAGILFGVGSAVLFYKLFLNSTGLEMWKVIIIAVDVVIAGILGDLFESMLKRDAGIKDSGNVIPGHGGILDRFDSLVIAAPVLYMFINAWL